MVFSSFFTDRNCEMPDLALLQPADPFLDMAGEDLRRRIFITTDQTGNNLCLRPEFTIPVCLHHLETGSPKARYAYQGPVFRQRREEAQEFPQAGIEDLGDADQSAADARAVMDALAALNGAGCEDVVLTMGDQSIFEAVLHGLELPEIWMKRLSRAFGDEALLLADLDRLSGTAGADDHLPDAVQAFLDAGDRVGLARHVEMMMADAGLPVSGGRTADEIVCRLAQKHELSNTRMSAEKREILTGFLALETALDQAVESLRIFEKNSGIFLGEPLSRLEQRLSDIDTGPAAALFKTSFGRRLDYYTGMVFEIATRGGEGPLSKPLAGGGRYNKLLSMLGAGETVPAVGFALWPDRIARTVSKTASKKAPGAASGAGALK